eukprot:gnl/MRDRNA2_/MRDRNA2_96444_c0_seq1.p1 gnl/MRDRNA2_/MRDRNA2_96444_c0~~gnl/MRDRNA2_/MRDRNA2_96444_c0_seq1.p1  ORF type:complete len:322 (+),score=41.56 gnl/MRDRNA2_/MRDRNA2_96444_c0_seq1:51-1016(+)
MAVAPRPAPFQGPLTYASVYFERADEANLTSRDLQVLYVGASDVAGRRHGIGQQRWHDGAIYDGSWESGRAHGRGAFRRPDGDTFEGHWEHNKPVDGRYVCLAGRGRPAWSYQGQFGSPTAIPNGQGRLVFADTHDAFEGQFKNGLKNGHGKYSWPDGSWYEGQWYREHFEGVGTLFDVRKYDDDAGYPYERFEGQWRQSTKHGFGSYSWLDDHQSALCSYVGQYREDRKHGAGIFLWTAPADGGGGVKYTGEFVAGRIMGIGRMTLQGGAEIYGRWRADAEDAPPALEEQLDEPAWADAMVGYEAGDRWLTDPGLRTLTP